MKKLTLNEYTTPSEVFKYLENLAAEKKWAREYTPPPSPKVEIVRVRGRAGYINFFKDVLLEMRP